MIRINLLPDEIKTEIAFAKRNAKLLQYLYMSIAVFCCFAGLIFILAFVLNTQQNLAKGQKLVAEIQIEEQGEAIKKAQDLYSRLEAVKKIKSQSIDWQFVFSEIARVTPANVQIDSFASPIAKERSRLTGIADTEQSIVALKENMASSELFGYVDIESITKSTDPNGSKKEVRAFIISYNLNLDKAKK